MIMNMNMFIMLRNKIDSNINCLDKLNQEYEWLPNSLSIRPTLEDIEKKKILYEKIELEWIGYLDYIYHEIFDFEYMVDKISGKKYINLHHLNNFDKHKKWIFKPSIFRYNLIPESNHWILWNTDKDFNYDYPDELINQIIFEEIKKIINNDYTNYYNYNDYDYNKIQFAWYKNPKPTIPEIYHIHVFWIN